jgi:hypothetical protein
MTLSVLSTTTTLSSSSRNKPPNSILFSSFTKKSQFLTKHAPTKIEPNQSQKLKGTKLMKILMMRVYPLSFHGEIIGTSFVN